MDILYLSSMLSGTEQKKLFSKYGSISSYASQRFNHLLTKGLLECGCNISALTYEIAPKDFFDENKVYNETEDGIDYEYIPYGSRNSIIRYATKRIIKWQKEHKDGFIVCDIILGELSIAVNLASMFHKINSVAIVTDVPLARAMDRRKGIKKIPVILKQKMIYNFKNYIFLTEQMNAMLNRKNRPYVVVEGVADGIAENLIYKKSEKKICMMAGLLEDEFGVGFLIDSFKKADVENAELIFYGKGTSVEYIEEENKKDERIKYAGQLTNAEIIEKEKTATLLINPRPPVGQWTAYSFPSKNIEYISSGTPLVAFKLAGIPDEYDEYFYKIPSNESDEFAKTLKELLNKPDKELIEFGARAQKWVLENKNPKIQAEKILKIFNI
ncbi:MAG: glycosyltransferase family 4 protein [Clostridia bacterium]|nr:glycosyltransferase family 4 protein [Clostridia bacterium]